MGAFGGFGQLSLEITIAKRRRRWALSAALDSSVWRSPLINAASEEQIVRTSVKWNVRDIKIPRLKRSADHPSPIPLQTRDSIFNHIFYYPIHRQTGSLTIHAALEKDQTPVADSFSNAGIHFSNKQNAAVAKCPPRQRSQNAHRGSGREMPTAAAVAECTPRQRSAESLSGKEGLSAKGRKFMLCRS